VFYAVNYVKYLVLVKMAFHKGSSKVIVFRLAINRVSCAILLFILLFYGLFIEDTPPVKLIVSCDMQLTEVEG
jgi:hypothetical protein